MTSIDNLHKAIAIQEQIENLQAQLNSLIQGGPAPILPSAVKLPSAVTSKPARKKGKMSAAGRAAIVAAQKARWAKINKEKADKAAPAKKAAKAAPVKPAKPEKKKRNVSPEVRAKLAAMMKARWAAKKATKKK